MSLDLQHTSRFSSADAVHVDSESGFIEKSSWTEMIITVTLTIAAVTAVSVIAVVMGLA